MTQVKNEKYDVWKRKIANRRPEREVRNRLLSVNEVIDKLGISRTALYNWRKSGRFPEGRRIAGSNLVKWSESTIDQWIEKEGL